MVEQQVVLHKINWFKLSMAFLAVDFCWQKFRRKNTRLLCKVIGVYLDLCRQVLYCTNLETNIIVNVLSVHDYTVIRISDVLYVAACMHATFQTIMFCCGTCARLMCHAAVGVSVVKDWVSTLDSSLPISCFWLELHCVFCSDYLFKLLLIGDSGVGKSCLLLRFAVSSDFWASVFVFFFLLFAIN